MGPVYTLITQLKLCSCGTKAFNKASFVASSRVMGISRKDSGPRRFLRGFFLVASNVDHFGRSILKSSELRFDRFDLISLLLVHNTGLQDLERL